MESRAGVFFGNKLSKNQNLGVVFFVEFFSSDEYGGIHNQ